MCDFRPLRRRGGLNMALSDARIHRGRPTPYPWEREALDRIYAGVSDNDPHQAWELHELHDPSTGRLYELDLVFLSRVGLFLVEIKSHPGVLTGDVVDWTFNDGGRRRTLECPYATVNHKAKVLAGLLERHVTERPFVHAAVFVSGATQVNLDGGRPTWLLTSNDAASKLVNGLDGQMPRRIVNRPMMKDLLQVAHKIGLRPSKAQRIVGGFQLGALMDEGEGYQEHLAQHGSLKHDKARIRSYLVPSATTPERRLQLTRAAEREAHTLSQLGQHAGILGYRTYVEDAPLGPAVVFEAFEDALPLHVFLRQEPDLTFDDRLHLLQSIVEAVAHCHRAGVLHRNLSPASVLVRRDPNGKLALRVHRFQTSTWIEHSSQGTRHVHDLANAIDQLYQAPEVLQDPQKATFESDAFSVGCLAWLLFTGQHPASSLAERDERLRASPEGGLEPSSVRADLVALDVAIALATRPNLYERPDNVPDWFDGWVLEALTRPAPSPEAILDPLEAQKGDALPGGLRVERRLGKGGTAVVLHVRREGKDFALKVPHDDVCGARLLAEAQVLRDLRHEHIVALYEVIAIGGRPCLLLEYAGDRALSDELREQGTLPLDLARRFGDDLLSSVQYLEERHVTHRDIKPSNIGFTGGAKQQQHLLLLDFSLAASDPTVTSAGTAEWRDPWLYLRGRWDASADRWSAAAVLYQALTGARPALASGAGAPEEVLIEAERFDAAVRDRLAMFFRKTFARDPSARFDATESMRHAWQRALLAESAPDPRVGPVEYDPTQVRLDTPVDALPLSPRALNALDRAGVALVADLLLLPRNQLSVIRGIGRRVAEEILAVAEELRAHHPVDAPKSLLPGFLRPRLSIDDPDVALPRHAVDTLIAAGITSTVDAAQAPRSRFERLVGPKVALDLVATLQQLADGEPAPGSLGDWGRALIGRASENLASRRLRVLVGLDPFPDGRSDTGHPSARSVPEVASAFEVDAAQIHSSLQFLRNGRWSESAAAHALVDTLKPLLHSQAIPLDELAATLAGQRCPEGAGVADLQLAAALIRVALELRPEPVAAWRRLDTGPWLASDPAVLDALPSLGFAADALAQTEPLPSTDTVRTTLAGAVADTALAALPHDQRVKLAARASRNAAASARLELYPRGMDPGRALTLSMAAITGAGLTPEVVRRRVAARYPDAQPLPDRPALDALLAPQGLVFASDVGSGEYVRPGQPALTSMTVMPTEREHTAAPGLPKRRSPDAQRAEAFQDQLDRGVASRRFRVIQVRADLAPQAADTLGEALGVTPVSLDHALVDALRAAASALEVAWANVEAADRAGPQGQDWPLLLDLVRRATDSLVERLLADGSVPLLLVWPGAFARYGLSGALARLVDRAERGDTHAVLLVVPSHADGLAPSINGRLPVPAPLPGQRLVLPESWLANAHRAAEIG